MLRGKLFPISGTLTLDLWPNLWNKLKEFIFFKSEYTRDWAGARLVSNIEIEQPIFTIKDTDYFYKILDPKLHWELVEKELL